MSETMLAVQDAVIVKLKADLSIPVFDDVPQGQGYPYVSVDRTISDSDDTSDEICDIELIWLAIWSDYAGRREVVRIMGEIKASLHDAKLSLTSGTAVSCRVESRQTNREPDGETYQGLVQVRVLSED